MATGYCACGCGERTRIATRTRSNIDMIKGEPLRYVDGHARRGWRRPYKTERYAIEERGYATPCWIWLLGRTGQGYACEWDSGRGRMVGAHILAYERAHGPVPVGLEIDHLCRERLCVNPAHLEAVSHEENVRRGDYTRNHWNARKTHCPKGHPYEGANLYIEPSSGTRRCRACRAASRAK